MFMKNFCIKVFVVACLAMTFISSSPVFAAKWYEYYEAAEKAIEKEGKFQINGIHI